MKKILSLFILVHLAITSNAQNDTLYLESNHLLLNNIRLNRSNYNGDRIGEWIEYEIDLIKVNSNLESTCGSGDNFHIYTETIEEYRTLREHEYNGILITIDSNTDTIDGVLYHDRVYKKILNRVPYDFYNIIGRGFYKNNKKEGDWKYYHKSGNLLKSINYCNGIPCKDFEIYRDDGSLMMSVSKADNDNWIITKYSSNREIIESLIGAIIDFKILY